MRRVCTYSVAVVVTQLLFLGAVIAEQSTLISGIAEMESKSGSDARGTVRFKQLEQGVHVSGSLSGLAPGKHGFHVHEFGNCSATDASSAGSHFAPAGNQHGDPKEQDHHVGDLGNIQADKDGVAKIDIFSKSASLVGKHSLVGRAIIVHANEDRFVQPAGDAGERVACGVIGIAQNKKS